MTFDVSAYGIDGSGVVPYLPEKFFSAGVLPIMRFHQIWFANRNPIGCYNCDWCCNIEQNKFHLIATKLWPGYIGGTLSETDMSFISIRAIEDEIQFYCGQVQCSGNELWNYIRYATDHEIAHQFDINSCDSGGHDTNNAWCGGAGGSCRSPCNAGMDEWCLMNLTEVPALTRVCQRSDGIDRMDCSDLSANSLCAEPDCSGPNHISVRTNDDPE